MARANRRRKRKARTNRLHTKLFTVQEWHKVQTMEEAREGMRHCLYPPRGDRVHSGSFLASHKRPMIMFQLETSKCMDNLAEMYTIPEVDFGFVGPGDLAMSMGLATRDGVPGMMAAAELRWCYKHIVDTVRSCSS